MMAQDRVQVESSHSAPVEPCPKLSWRDEISGMVRATQNAQCKTNPLLHPGPALRYSGRFKELLIGGEEARHPQSRHQKGTSPKKLVSTGFCSLWTVRKYFQRFRREQFFRQFKTKIRGIYYSPNFHSQRRTDVG